ncbi:MAG TPA: hypothetical protein DCZ61_05175, partial [Lachnospiraceae bacterium]|nr:hypothetical protein [Lachnospiraceae bacterium]
MKKKAIAVLLCMALGISTPASEILTGETTGYEDSMKGLVDENLTEEQGKEGTSLEKSVNSEQTETGSYDMFPQETDDQK